MFNSEISRVVHKPETVGTTLKPEALIKLEQLIELARPELQDKRTHAVAIALKNGTFVMTEVANRFVPVFYSTQEPVPSLSNLCQMHGYTHLSLI